MRKTTTGAMVLGWALLVCAGAARADGINWSHDLGASEGQARDNNRMVMLDVYTDWCGWCKKLDSDVYTNAQVIRAAAQLYPVKLNAEREGQQAAQRYRVNGYPCILFLDGNGNMVGRIGGYLPANDFAEQMQQFMTDFAEFPQLELKARNNPTDAATVLKLIPSYIARERPDDAARVVGPIMDQLGADAGSWTNAIAGGYAAVGNSNSAIEWYNKTVTGSTKTEDLVNAHIGLYNVYGSLRNAAAMKRELQAILQLPGASEQVKNEARSMLQKLG